MSSAKRGRKGTGPRKRPKKEKKQTRFSFWNPGYFDAPDESHDEDDDAPEVRCFLLFLAAGAFFLLAGGAFFLVAAARRAGSACPRRSRSRAR